MSRDLTKIKRIEEIREEAKDRPKNTFREEAALEKEALASTEEVTPGPQLVDEDLMKVLKRGEALKVSRKSDPEADLAAKKVVVDGLANLNHQLRAFQGVVGDALERCRKGDFAAALALAATAGNYNLQRLAHIFGQMIQVGEPTWWERYEPSQTALK